NIKIENPSVSNTPTKLSGETSNLNSASDFFSSTTNIILSIEKKWKAKDSSLLIGGKSDKRDFLKSIHKEIINNIEKDKIKTPEELWRFFLLGSENNLRKLIEVSTNHFFQSDTKPYPNYLPKTVLKQVNVIKNI